MAPEQEARERAFYDHESEEPRRRRRPAADWGVGEDIFDRMPSRHFKRRAEHREVVLRRSGQPGPRRDVEIWTDEDAPRENEAPRRAVAIWTDDDAPREDEAPRRAVAIWTDDDVALPTDGDAPRPAADERGSRRPVESWLDDEARPPARGESRTIVLARSE